MEVLGRHSSILGCKEIQKGTYSLKVTTEYIYNKFRPHLVVEHRVVEDVRENRHRMRHPKSGNFGRYVQIWGHPKKVRQRGAGQGFREQLQTPFPLVSSPSVLHPQPDRTSGHRKRIFALGVGRLVSFGRAGVDDLSRDLKVRRVSRRLLN